MSSNHLRVSTETIYRLKLSWSVMISGKIISLGRLHCPIEYTKGELFFSLVDYRNNYFTSDDPNKIIEFFNGFENRDQLIRWMKERPNGVGTIHEVDDDKEIIVVIPTADFNGKFAQNCINIFKSFHIIFVESGGRGDFYFNIARNINIGLKRALEYNPKWIFFSSDDVYKIDSVQKLKEELKNIDHESYNFVSVIPSFYHSQTTAIAKKIKLTYIIYIILKYGNRGLSRLRIEKKFSVEYSRFPTAGISRLFGKFFFKTKRVIIENGDVAIFSYKYVKSLNGEVYDEIFVNAFEETDLAFRLSTDCAKISRINYRIGDYIGSTLGTGTRRMIHDIAGLIYFNMKWHDILETL